MRYEPGLSVMHQLVRRASEVTGLSEADVTGPARKQSIFRVRCAVIAVARQQGLTFHRIARHLNRDHTTIMEATRSMSKFREDADWTALVRELEPS